MASSHLHRGKRKGNVASRPFHICDKFFAGVIVGRCRRWRQGKCLLCIKMAHLLPPISLSSVDHTAVSSRRSFVFPPRVAISSCCVLNSPRGACMYIASARGGEIPDVSPFGDDRDALAMHAGCEAHPIVDLSAPAEQPHAAETIFGFKALLESRPVCRDPIWRSM